MSPTSYQLLYPAIRLERVGPMLTIVKADALSLIRTPSFASAPNRMDSASPRLSPSTWSEIESSEERSMTQLCVTATQ